ncbi:MAG TPA: BTAD domain-containing putative transcriptional regulator [Candidatus Polarisedimenticolia bacterium]|nr:BTAD domain-containing putative transcriptional regulator [Candidatus Polarisedimenticolia bacterium]
MPTVPAGQPPPLLRFKMIPPAPGLSVLRRPRLMDRMRESLEDGDRRGTAIIAGAGYGKTTLAASFLREASVESVWYTLDPSDRDPRLFFRYLIEVIRRRCDDFGRLAEELLRENAALSGDAAVDRFVDVLINDARETLAGRIVLCLDDVHQLEGSASVMRGLRRLLAHMPDALHIVFTSRTTPRIGLRRLKLQGRVRLIEQDDLAFTLEETRHFLQAYGLPAEDARLEGLHAQARGWVTALQLLRHQTMTGHANDARPDEARLARTREEVFDYFGDDVYSHEDGQIRLFLRRSCPPEILDASILSCVLDDMPVRGILENLQRRHLFIVPLGAPEGTCAYHPLFRDFLARKLLEVEGEPAARELHARYGSAYEQHGDHAAALRHYQEAGASAALAALLAREGPSMVEHGMLDTVRRACDAMGDPAVHPPRLLLLRAEIQRIEGDYAGASRAFDAGIRAAPDLSPQERAAALQGKAYAEMKLGAVDDAQALSREALGLLDEGEHGLRARILNTLSIAHHRLGRYDDAIAGWKEALELARRAGDRALVRRVAHNLGLPHAMRGEYDAALDYFRMLLQLEEDAGSPPSPEYATATLNVARIEILRGRLREAAGRLDDALEISRKFDLKALRGDVLEAQGNLLRESGDAQGARERYAAARAIFTELGLEELRDNVEEEETRLLLWAGAPGEALRRAEELLARGGSSEAPAARRASLMQLAGEARLRSAERSDGPVAGAVALLERARELNREIGQHYQEAEAGLLLARAILLSGDPVRARAEAEAGLWIAVRFGYSHMAQRAAQGSRLFQDLLAALPEWRTMARQGGEGQDAGRVLVAGAEDDLIIRLLGAVEVYRDERKRIPASAWTLRKALRILCFLCASRERRATKDRIVDTFWPDASPDVIERNFHPTISYLRKALNMSHPVRKNFILFERGAYLLNPRYRYRIDLAEFEDGIRAARVARRSDPEGALRRYDAALRLYRGDFLEEEYDDWAEAPRTHYAGLYTAGLEEAGSLLASLGRWEPAQECFARLVQRDPFGESASCGLMEAFSKLGNRAGVVQEYERLTRALREELDMDPLPDTRAVYESALGGGERQKPRRKSRKL